MPAVWFGDVTHTLLRFPPATGLTALNLRASLVRLPVGLVIPGLERRAVAVVAGLPIGKVGRAYAMSDTTVGHLDAFRELIDAPLNTGLFVLIAVGVPALTLTGSYLRAGVLAIPVVMLGRLASVEGSVAAVRRRAAFPWYTIRRPPVGGLRGRISVALAPLIPAAAGGVRVPDWELVVALTDAVVVFSIPFHEWTGGPLARRRFPSVASASRHSPPTRGRFSRPPGSSSCGSRVGEVWSWSSVP